MGVIAELFSDEQGLVWPENIAPFSLYLINIGDSAEVREMTQDVYDRLTADYHQIYKSQTYNHVYACTDNS